MGRTSGWSPASRVAAAAAIAGAAMAGAAACGGGSGTTGPADASVHDATGRDARREADATGDASRRDAARDAHATDGPSADGDAAAEAGCPAAGSGKSTYTCPAGGHDVLATDDIAAAVSGSAEGDTLCIHGLHRITAPLVPKKNQTWIGVDATAGIDGSAVLAPWAPAPGMPGVWVYSGALASQQTQNGLMSTGVYACYLVSTYEDDVFYGDQRVMRVLSTAQLTGAALPPGQAVTAAETGRFFFDYSGKKIYLALDPSKATVELATVSTLIDGAGVEGVTLENLLVQKALDTAIKASKSSILTDVTARHAHEVGVQVGSGTEAAPTTLQRVLMTSNGRYGLSGAGSWLTVEDSELSWNNIANHVRVQAGSGGGCDYMTGAPGGYWGAGAAKIVLASGGSVADPDFKLLGMQSHDNVGVGFWTDVNNRYVLVQGGRFYRNESSGYFHEIGCDIEITGIEADHNGTPIKNTGQQGYGVVLSDSNNGSVHDNVVHDNASGTVGLIWQLGHSGISGMTCVSPPPSSDTDTTNVLKDNSVVHNEVYSCASGARTGMVYGSTESLVSRGNVFVKNAYHMPDTTSTWWDDGKPLSWSAWQALGLDTSGTATASCTYAAPPSCGK